MRATLFLSAALLSGPALTAPVPNLTMQQGETIARAAVGLAFAHGCATFVNAPFLVRDGLRLLELAYSGAGMPDPSALANDAYWKIITTIQDGQFGPSGTFDAAACQVVQSAIADAVAETLND